MKTDKLQFKSQVAAATASRQPPSHPAGSQYELTDEGVDTPNTSDWFSAIGSQNYAEFRPSPYVPSNVKHVISVKQRFHHNGTAVTLPPGAIFSLRSGGQEITSYECGMNTGGAWQTAYLIHSSLTITRSQYVDLSAKIQWTADGSGKPPPEVEG